MTGTKRVFLDFTDYYSLVTTGTNCDQVVLYPKEYMAVHNGTSLGLQKLSIQGTEMVEVVYSAIDALGSVGKYTVDPVTNSVILLVAKGSLTETTAKKQITGMLLEYNLSTLAYYSSDALYTMETYSASGELVSSTSASSMTILNNKMVALDTNLNPNSSLGYYEHRLRRALTV